MSYVARPQKWGETEYGTESGEIFWTADLSTGLQFDTGDNSLSDFETELQDAFDAWEAISGLNFTYVDDGSQDITVEVANVA